MGVDGDGGGVVVGGPGQPVSVPIAVTIGVAVVVEEKPLRMALAIRKVENDPVRGVFDSLRRDDLVGGLGKGALWDPRSSANE